MTEDDEDELGRLASYCFDAAKAADGQVAAVVGWLGHAAMEEGGWRTVDLRGAGTAELDRLRIVAAVHRGRSEWRRDADEMVPIEMDPRPWSQPVRAVCDEQDRRKDETDDLAASWRQPADFGGENEAVAPDLTIGKIANIEGAPRLLGVSGLRPCGVSCQRHRSGSRDLE